MAGVGSNPISVNLLIKKCNDCGETFHISNFYPIKTGGWRPTCKPCNNASAAAWQGANREKCSESTSRWRDRDPEHARALDRARYAKDPQKAMKRILEYEKRNRKLCSDKMLAWSKTPAGRVNAAVQTHRRRARLLDAYSPDADARIREIRSSTQQCYICGDWLPPGDVTVDHVIPLARGGRHSATNLNPSCSYCNTSKGARSLEEVLA